MEIRIVYLPENRKLIATPDVQVVPRVGEIVCVKDWDGKSVTGVVQSVMHNINDGGIITIEVRIA